MNNIRIIGDAHGKLEEYIRLANEAKNGSLLMGELLVGDHFDMSPLTDAYAAGRLNHEYNLILPGNHDNYRVIHAIRSFLVNPGYGLFDIGPLGDIISFYVRGATSIDRAMRVEGRDWWPEEELSMRVLESAVEYYKSLKPEVMCTHTCPTDIVSKMLDPGQVNYRFRTEQALQVMFETHQPKIWVFGHFHKTRSFEVNGTTFIALGELATCDLDLATMDFILKGKDGFAWGEGGY